MESIKEELVNNCSLFLGLQVSDFPFTDSDFEEENFEAGGVIFREGGAADKVYFIIRGEVNLLDNKLLDRTNIVSRRIFDFFGYEDVLKNMRRTSTAIAIRDTFLLSVDSEKFADVLKNSEPMQTNIKTIFENEKEELLGALELLVDEEQRELNVPVTDVDAEDIPQYDENNIEEEQSPSKPKNPFDRTQARNKRHSDKRMERMRRTIIEFDDIESEVSEKEKENESPLLELGGALSDEDKERGFGKIVTDDIVIIVVFLKRATMEKAGEFKNYIIDTITFGSKKVIVDLSRTEFIDSTFLGVLVASLKRIVAKKGDLRLVFSKEEPLGLLQLTRMDKIFNIYNQLNDAMVSFDK